MGKLNPQLKKYKWNPLCLRYGGFGNYERVIEDVNRILTVLNWEIYLKIIILSFLNRTQYTPQYLLSSSSWFFVSASALSSSTRPKITQTSSRRASTWTTLPHKASTKMRTSWIGFMASSLLACHSFSQHQFTWLSSVSTIGGINKYQDTTHFDKTYLQAD